MTQKSRTFVFSKMFFKIISSKKYSTVFNVFRFIVTLRSSVLTSTRNHSIRVIQKGLRARRPPEAVCNKNGTTSLNICDHHKKTSLYLISLFSNEISLLVRTFLLHSSSSWCSRSTTLILSPEVIFLLVVRCWVCKDFR